MRWPLITFFSVNREFPSCRKSTSLIDLAESLAVSNREGVLHKGIRLGRNRTEFLTSNQSFSVDSIKHVVTAS